MSRAATSSRKISLIHAPEVHAVMYAFLLVATPFILLRNYLVQAISVFSDFGFSLAGLEIKIVPLIAATIFAGILVILRKRFTKLSLLSVAIVILLNALAQQITDFYFGHKFYDLQQNWHYIAYGLYSFMVYRALYVRRLPLHRVMLITYFSAFGFSLFDEFFQMFMSSRIFDVCDIGKDVWGVLMGMVIVYFSGHYSQALFKDWRKIRHASLRQYYRHPFTLLLLMFILSLIFLVAGSLLTESEYAPLVFGMTIILFIVAFMILHLSQFKTGKIILLAILATVLLTQAYFYVKYRDKNIIYNRYGLTVYRGIPIPYFDIMVYPNGVFRLVDKKHFFNQRDRDFLFQQKSDIIVIGGGADGKGGKGFNDPHHLFQYNKWAKKGTQIIIEKNPEAIRTFNRLKNEGKSVLFVLHNTC